jgi:hypothetical protein
MTTGKILEDLACLSIHDIKTLLTVAVADSLSNVALPNAHGTGASKVCFADNFLLTRCAGKRLVVKGFLENALDRPVLAILEKERAPAGCVKSFCAVGFGKPKDTLCLAQMG